MGHIRIVMAIALLAGCAAETGTTGDDVQLETAAPPDVMTCMVGNDWDETVNWNIYSSKRYRMFQCWTGAAEDRKDSALPMLCVKAHDANRYACVEDPPMGGVIPGTWYSFEGGAVNRNIIPDGTNNFSGPADAFVLEYAGPAFGEHDCKLERDPMLEAEWCNG